MLQRKTNNDTTSNKNILSLIFLLCTTFAFGNNGIETSLSLDRSIINYKDNLVNYRFEISNNSLESIKFVTIEVLVKLKTQTTFSDKLDPLFSGDTNNNEALDPDEIWVFSGSKTFENVPGQIYEVIGTCVMGEEQEYIFVKADQLFCVGINMETNIDLDQNLRAGDTINVSLTTRLLIDEDGASNPGFSTIKVGDKEMKVALPATRWEARDLMISATMLNGGEAFDPFNPPAGIELINFCDQENRDQGRNVLNVLDEADPIETVRAPCTEFGENDIGCEFPDWVFCYDIILPEDYEKSSMEIRATDQFTMWQSKETSPGSGAFGPFRDMTNRIEAGGEDSAIKFVEDIVWSDFIIESDIDSDLVYISTFVPSDRIQIVIYNRQGQLVFDKNLQLSDSDQLIDLVKGDYVIFAFDSKKRELGNIKISLTK